MSEVGGCAARSDEITQREETSMAQKMYYPPEELVKNAAVSGMDHYKRLVAEADRSTGQEHKPQSPPATDGRAKGQRPVAPG